MICEHGDIRKPHPLLRNLNNKNKRKSLEAKERFDNYLRNSQRMDNQSEKLNKNKFEREDSRFDLDNDERDRRKSFHPRHNS